MKPEEIVIKRAADMRYVGQEHAVTVDIPLKVFAKRDRNAIKRLFDEKTFRAYGPYSYDLNRLMSWDRDQQEAELEPVQPRAS